MKELKNLKILDIVVCSDGLIGVRYEYNTTKGTHTVALKHITVKKLRRRKKWKETT